MKLAFRAKWLPLLYPFMAQQDIRYYLNGICVKPWGKGVLLAATDGHALAMVYDDQGAAEREAILHVWPETLRACTSPRYGHWGRGLGALERWVVAEALESTQEVNAARVPNFRVVVNIGAQLQRGATEVYVQAGHGEIDGKYPDYSRVVPKAEDLKPGHPGMFQLHLLDRLPKARTKQQRYTGAKFYSTGKDNEVLVVHLPHTPEFLAMFMPVRDDAQAWGGKPLPAWWSDNLQPLPAAAKKLEGKAA